MMHTLVSVQLIPYKNNYLVLGDPIEWYQSGHFIAYIIMSLDNNFSVRYHLLWFEIILLYVTVYEKTALIEVSANNFVKYSK